MIRSFSVLTVSVLAVSLLAGGALGAGEQKRDGRQIQKRDRTCQSAQVVDQDLQSLCKGAGRGNRTGPQDGTGPRRDGSCQQ